MRDAWLAKGAIILSLSGIAATPSTVNYIWSDRPTFIIQGNRRSLMLYQDSPREPI